MLLVSSFHVPWSDSSISTVGVLDELRFVNSSSFSPMIVLSALITNVNSLSTPNTIVVVTIDVSVTFVIVYSYTSLPLSHVILSLYIVNTESYEPS